MTDIPVPPLPAPAPGRLAEYMRARGWRALPEMWRGAEIWQAPDRAGDEVLLPPRIVYRDDEDLVRRALQTVAKAERRDVAAVLRDISRPLVDRQVFRTYPDTPSGTVPLLSGCDAVGGIRSAFTVAARSVLHREGAVLSGGRNSRAVEAFLSRIRLGPTEAGSYILTTEVPVTPPESDMLFDLGGDQTGRSVVRFLRQGTAAAGKAVRASSADRNDSSAFDAAFEDGVTGRLCDALANFAGHAADRPFEISFDWAPARPMEPVDEDRVAFSPDAGRILKRAAEYLRVLENQGTVTLRGRIIALERDSLHHAGYARVRGLLVTDRGAGQRTLRVRLDPIRYEQALDAHARGAEITVEGRISTTGNRRELVPDTTDFG